MKKIYVGFSRPKGKLCPCFSWGIRAFQGWTPYSHVYVKIESKSFERDLIYQASGLQVNFMGSNYFYEHVHMIEEFEVSISDENFKKMVQFCIDNAGKPYSKRDIAAILFQKEEWLDGRDKFICSELAAIILEDYTDVSFNKPLGLVTPKNIYEMLKNR